MASISRTVQSCLSTDAEELTMPSLSSSPPPEHARHEHDGRQAGERPARGLPRVRCHDAAHVQRHGHDEHEHNKNRERAATRETPLRSGWLVFRLDRRLAASVTDQGVVGDLSSTTATGHGRSPLLYPSNCSATRVSDASPYTSLGSCLTFTRVNRVNRRSISARYVRSWALRDS